MDHEVQSTVTVAAVLTPAQDIKLWCRCKPARPYYPVGRRIFTVRDRNNTRSMMEIRSYCLDCKGVLEPAVERLCVCDAEGEDTLLRARAIIRGRTGSSETNGAALGIDWTQLLGLLDIPRVRVQQLYTDWSAHKQGTPLVHEALCKQVGLSAAVTSRPIWTPCGSIAIDHRTVNHPLDVAFPDRYDADHCSYFGLTITTLTSPLEVWLAEAEDGKPRRLRYLAGYVVGLTIHTHVVIVDEPAQRVITAYRLHDHETRTEKKRQGLLKYSGWK